MLKLLIFSSTIFLMQDIFAQNPSLTVLDTDFSKGRLSHQQIISLEDVAKFHGHLCDGLAVGFLGLREALHQLYPDSLKEQAGFIISTTVTRDHAESFCIFGWKMLPLHSF